MTQKRWMQEEKILLYYSYIHKTNLSDLEGILGRSGYSITRKLATLAAPNRKRWFPAYSFYYHKLYLENKERILARRKTRYLEQKEKLKQDYIDHKEERNKSFKEYYTRVLKKKPHKEEAKKLKLYIEAEFGSVPKFARYLIEKGIIKSKFTPYLWVNGYRWPRKMEDLAIILKIPSEEFDALESRVKSRVN